MYVDIEFIYTRE